MCRRNGRLWEIVHNGRVVKRSDRRSLAYEAALLYFVEQQTMEAISRKLGVSRSTVSRLLAAAREEGRAPGRTAVPVGYKGFRLVR